MTKEQREKLARRVTALLRQEWGSEFTDNDAVRIYDFCLDEVDGDEISWPLFERDVENIAAQFELKYG